MPISGSSGGSANIGIVLKAVYQARDAMVQALKDTQSLSDKNRQMAAGYGALNSAIASLVNRNAQLQGQLDKLNEKLERQINSVDRAAQAHARLASQTALTEQRQATAALRMAQIDDLRIRQIERRAAAEARAAAIAERANAASIASGAAAANQAFRSAQIAAAGGPSMASSFTSGSVMNQIGAGSFLNFNESGQLRSNITQAIAAQGQMAQSNRSLATSFFTLRNAIAAVGVVKFAQELLEANSKLTAVSAGFGAVFGASSGEEIAFVRGEAEKLGQVFTDLSTQYIRFSAAAKELNIPMAETHRIFDAVLGAATVLRLSSSEVQLTLRAIEQMLSKGKVVSEELTKQLSQYIPGAKQIFAKGMGVSSREFEDMMKSGSVDPARALGGFATELTTRYGPQVEAASKSAAAEINRLSTAWTDFMKAVGDAGAIDALVGALRSLKDALKGISGVLPSGGVTGAAVGGLGQAGIAGLLSAGGGIGVAALGSAIGNLARSASLASVQFTLMAGAAGVVGIALQKLIIAIGEQEAEGQDRRLAPLDEASSVRERVAKIRSFGEGSKLRAEFLQRSREVQAEIADAEKNAQRIGYGGPIVASDLARINNLKELNRVLRLNADLAFDNAKVYADYNQAVADNAKAVAEDSAKTAEHAAQVKLLREEAEKWADELKRQIFASSDDAGKLSILQQELSKNESESKKGFSWFGGEGDAAQARQNQLDSEKLRLDREIADLQKKIADDAEREADAATRQNQERMKAIASGVDAARGKYIIRNAADTFGTETDRVGVVNELAGINNNPFLSLGDKNQQSIPLLAKQIELNTRLIELAREKQKIQSTDTSPNAQLLKLETDREINSLTQENNQLMLEQQSISFTLGEQFKADLEEWGNAAGTLNQQLSGVGMAGINAGVQAFSQNMTQAIMGAKSFGDAITGVMRSVAEAILQTLIQVIAMRVVLSALGYYGPIGGYSQGGEIGAGGQPLPGHSTGGMARGFKPAPGDNVIISAKTGEGVLNEAAMKANMNWFNYMNRGGKVDDAVSAGGRPGMDGSMGGSRIDGRVTVAMVDSDAALMALLNSSGGQRMISSMVDNRMRQVGFRSN